LDIESKLISTELRCAEVVGVLALLSRRVSNRTAFVLSAVAAVASVSLG